MAASTSEDTFTIKGLEVAKLLVAPYFQHNLVIRLYKQIFQRSTNGVLKMKKIN